MNTKQLNIMLWLIFCSLILLGGILLFKASKNPQFDALAYLSGSATFVIALLTIIYVVTTRKQFEVMSRQLDEMKKNRELQNQPLPWPIKLRVWSEKPRFFFSPPGNRFEVVSRHFIDLELKNIGASPAVSIDVCCFLIIPDKSLQLSATSIRIDVLEEGQKYPLKNEKKISFLYPTDNEAKILNNLINSNIKNLPIVELNILFRNILGACFYIKQQYRLYPKEDDRENIKDWLERLTIFPIRYKEKIELLYKQRKPWDDKTNLLFEELKQQSMDGLHVNQIDYRAFSIPASGEVSCINLSEYQKAVNNLSYPVLMIKGYNCISASDEK